MYIFSSREIDTALTLCKLGQQAKHKYAYRVSFDAIPFFMKNMKDNHVIALTDDEWQEFQQTALYKRKEQAERLEKASIMREVIKYHENSNLRPMCNEI